MLFGGLPVGSSTNPNSYLGDTWEYDGTDWIKQFPPTVPGARFLGAMAYDPSRARTVMHGGDRYVGGLDDTWSWDGRDWSREAPTRTPGKLAGHAMVYEPERGRCQLLPHTPPDAVWEWNGLDWSQAARFGDRLPHATLYYRGVAYDPVRRTVWTFGGYTGNANVALTAEWRWLPNASFTTAGPGCRGGTPPAMPILAPHATLGSLPWLGSTFALQGDRFPFRLPPLLLVGGSRLDPSLPLPGAAGCLLHVDPASAVALPVHAGLSRPTQPVWTVAIPSSPSLVGGSLWLQAVAPEPSANTLGILLSNAGHGVLGVR